MYGHRFLGAMFSAIGQGWSLSDLVQNKKREHSTVSFGSENFQQNSFLQVKLLYHKVPEAILAGGDLSLNPEALAAFNVCINR